MLPLSALVVEEINVQTNPNFKLLKAGDPKKMMPLTVVKIQRTGWLWFLKTQKYTVIDGVNRYLIARAANYKTIPCKIIKGIV